MHAHRMLCTLLFTPQSIARTINYTIGQTYIHNMGVYMYTCLQLVQCTALNYTSIHNPILYTHENDFKTYTLTPLRALAVNIIPRMRARKNTDTSPQITNEHVWSSLSITRFESRLYDSVKRIQQRTSFRSNEETPWGTLLMEEVLSFLDLILTCSLVKLPNEMTARTQRMARGTTMEM